MQHIWFVAIDLYAQKDLLARTGRDETKGKSQERMERRSRKRSSSAGSEKMERVGDREKMERYCSTGQSPQRAVAPTEEEEGYVMHHQFNIQQLYALPTLYLCILCGTQNKQRLVPLTA